MFDFVGFDFALRILAFSQRQGVIDAMLGGGADEASPLQVRTRCGIQSVTGMMVKRMCWDTVCGIDLAGEKIDMKTNELSNYQPTY